LAATARLQRLMIGERSTFAISRPSSIDHFVMAITSAESVIWHVAFHQVPGLATTQPGYEAS
jgi:hypothetical protein